MALISSNNKELLAVSFKNKLKIFRKSCLVLDFVYTDESKGKDESKKSNEDKNKCEKSPLFDYHQFSGYMKERDACFFGALTENKKLLVWKISLNGDIKLLMEIEFPKRPTSLTFLHNEAAVLVSDKYGDVYKSIITENPVPPPTIILGHLSMVLDVEVSEQDELVLSADRDEKIRISRYPNAYSIVNYCLGHKNLVSCIKTICKTKLISTSADKTARLWDFREGKELCCLELKTLTGKDFVPKKFVLNGSDVILMGEKCRGLVLLTLDGDELVYKEMMELDIQPVDICCNQNDGYLYVLCANSESPLRLYSKNADNTKYEEKTLSEDVYGELMKLKEDFPVESTYLTNLVKPVRGKRVSSMITPESTINFEGTYESGSYSKQQRIDEEEDETKVAEDGVCKMEE